MTPPPAPAAAPIDIGMFAHDEAAGIAAAIADLGRQTLLSAPARDVRALVLANGCADDTAARARAARDTLPAPARDRIEIVELAEGGKSRTWNHFVHELSRAEARTLVCMDADILMPDADLMDRLVAELDARPALRIFSSRPVKDLVHDGSAAEAGLAARLIAASGGTLDDFRTAICGQLYAARAGALREVWMPAGLPVEDGFLRAMILTDLLTAPEDLSRLDARPELIHVYESERDPAALIRHQTRIVIGGAINLALFRLMRREAPDLASARALLRAAAADEGWLRRRVAEELPRAPFGYVPFEFLTKRLRGPREGRFGARRLATLALGLGFDAAVWLNASLRMARGAGAGHW